MKEKQLQELLQSHSFTKEYKLEETQGLLRVYSGFGERLITILQDGTFYINQEFDMFPYKQIQATLKALVELGYEPRGLFEVKAVFYYCDVVKESLIEHIRAIAF